MFIIRITVSAVAFLIALFTLCFGLLPVLKGKERLKKYLIYGTCISSIIASSLFALLVYEKVKINKALSPLRQFERYTQNHKYDDLQRLSGGELKGIINAGMIILERHQSKNPEGYKNMKTMVYDNYNILEYEERSYNSFKLREAASTVLTTVRDLYVIEDN